MLDRLEERLAALLRISPVPDPPAGTQGSARIFRAAPAYYRYRLALWALKQAGALSGLLLFFLLMTVPAAAPLVAEIPWDDLPLPEPARGVLRTILLHLSSEEPPAHPVVRLLASIEWIGAGIFLLQLPLTYMLLRLDYRMRWYILTDRSLRVREGVNRVREATMTFANIQNVAVRQGPVQRVLGIADLEVRTAGGGARQGNRHEAEAWGKAHSVHVAYFRGVADAEAIRDRILAHLRRMRDAGLGDPDDARATGATTSWEEEAVRAARELRDEARALAAVMIRT